MICAWTERSSAEVGSSSRMNSGSSAIARAIARRWRWPPENSCGKREVMVSGRPASRSAALHPLEPVASALAPMPLTISPSSMIWRTDMRGLSEENGSWNTICIRERRCCICWRL